jgi:hypothetical protein
MKLRSLNLEDYEDPLDDGWYDIDLYPDRKFTRTVNILLYKHESWGNYHYYNYFKRCDEQNIKVRVFTSFVLFPIASLVGHEIILQETENSHFMGGKGFFYFDRKYAWSKYELSSRWESSRIDKDLPSSYIGKNWELLNLFEWFQNRTMYIDKRAVEKFHSYESFMPKNGVWIAYRERYQCLLDRIKNCLCVPLFNENNEKCLEFNEHCEGYNYLLTYQILCSIFRNVKFIAFAGAASLFTATPLINCVLMADIEHNVGNISHLFKACFNEQVFGCPVHNFVHRYSKLKSFDLFDELTINYMVERLKSIRIDDITINLDIEI